MLFILQTVGSSNIKVTALENENTRLKQEIKSQILRNEELETGKIRKTISYCTRRLRNTYEHYEPRS